MLTACGGFLLAVLWMDLIFDSQVLPHRAEPELPTEVIESIAAYYRRATTTSRPMSALIALVMVILLAGLVFQLLRGHHPLWVPLLALVLALAAIAPAALRTVPNAVRLGSRVDPFPEQSRLARLILRDHITSAICMLAFVILWSVQPVFT
ncbi:hypothetical protein [Nocardia sp. NPDC004860]|uniref:hypothetical protein n=1 Tax=Nocardia sp. NPDC004860 TaxID=3154557 RepID=UPI0033AD9BE9